MHLISNCVNLRMITRNPRVLWKIQSVCFHSSHVSLGKWRTKCNDNYKSYTIGGKRAHEKRALRDIFLAPLENSIEDGSLNWGEDKYGSNTVPRDIRGRNNNSNSNSKSKKKNGSADGVKEKPPHVSTYAAKQARRKKANDSTFGFEWELPDISSSLNRSVLGLPSRGPLNMDDIKSAFRSSALKWHPDKHQALTQAEAAEKFKKCYEAYQDLSKKLAPH